MNLIITIVPYITGAAIGASLMYLHHLIVLARYEDDEREKIQSRFN